MDPSSDVAVETSGAPDRPGTDRVEAFSDAVMAVIITIMVLNLRPPAGPDFGHLAARLPAFLVYILSFVFIGIYWNNHHHLFMRTERVSGAVMWANLHLLFWLSLIPVVTAWIGSSYRHHLPAAVYGVVCLGAAMAYTVLTRTIVAANGRESAVSSALGSDRKGWASIAIYVAGVGLAAASPYAAYACYLSVSALWFVPDRRMIR